MNTRIKELRETQARLITEARSSLDQITESTPEDRAGELESQHDRAMAEYDRVGQQISREERLAEAESRQNTQEADAERRAREGRRPGGYGEQAGHVEPGNGEAVTYRSAFHAMLASGGDIGALTTEERAVLRTGAPAAEMRTQTAGTGSAGGYTVPTELFGEIVKTMKDWGPMLDPSIARVITTSSGNPINIPTNDDTSGTAAIKSEGTAPTDDGSADLTFGQKSLSAYVYDTKWVKASLELLQDSAFNVEQYIGEALGERLARKGNAILTNGTGSSQPGGVATLASTGKTFASATAITGDELIDLQHSVNAAYRRSPKCRWMFADSTFQALRKLKDGNGDYVFSSASLTAGVPDRLLGYEFSINDDMPAMTTGLDAIAFGDFSRFWVRIVGAPVVYVARERFIPDVGLLGLIRLDGELVDSAAIKVGTMA